MKRMLAIVLAFLILTSCSAPVSATALSVCDPVTGLPFELAVYSDAYIDFTLRLDSLGIIPLTSIESFVSNYRNGDYDSIGSYVERMVSTEQLWATQTAPIVTMSRTQNEANSARSTGGMWYDNIINASGDIELNHAPYYGYYNLMTKVKAGDIIQETKGSLVTEITGHIAIVQGKYYDQDYLQYYIRTIEANPDGVVYGVLDDNRINNRGINIYYVSSANNSAITGAIEFCFNQIGKPYNYDGLFGAISHCQVNGQSTSKWYCTELVWAAYYNQGINLYDVGGIPANIYMPADFADCAGLSIRGYT